ncbi:MAG: zinc-binding dehydrogenase [Deltaproteobacteria bacterium]|nr:zinc-binding dehydrogenase [Deltaproteobacteria bacterium]
MVEVGGKVKDIRVGDRVAALGLGAMAHYVSIPKASLGATVFKLPEGLSYEEAATIEPLATSFHACSLAGTAQEEHVVVFGAGIIGLGIVQCLVAQSKRPSRLKKALDMGATHAIHAGEERAREKIVSLCGTRPSILFPGTAWPDVAVTFDAVGHQAGTEGKSVLDQAIEVVREGGSVVEVGIFECPVTMDFNVPVSKQVRIQGSFAYTPQELSKCIDLAAAGVLARKSLVTHEFPLERAEEAFDTQARSDASVKVLLKP